MMRLKPGTVGVLGGVWLTAWCAGNVVPANCVHAVKPKDASVPPRASKSPNVKGVTSSIIATRDTTPFCILLWGFCSHGTTCQILSGNVLSFNLCSETSVGAAACAAGVISECVVNWRAPVYAWTIALALGKRCCGSLFNARRITCSTGREIAWLICEGGCGSSPSCFQYTATGVLPVNGVRPVSIW